MWLLDASGATVFANRPMLDLLGLPPELVLGRPVEDVVDPVVAAQVRERLVRRGLGTSERFELRLAQPDGSERWLAVTTTHVPAGTVTEVPDGGSVALVVDVTERNAYEEAMRQLALYDLLTGLPNRALLDVQLEAAADRLAREGEHFSYLLLDVDGLKLVNDGLGSAQGDNLIREVGLRLSQSVGPGDWIGRTTGDRFVVLCRGTGSSQAEDVARGLVAAVEGPLELEGSTVWPSVCAGAASTESVEPKALAAAADAALQRAKRQGRGSAVVFRAASPRDHRANLEMVAELRAALRTGALQLRYQPIVRLATNEVAGAEALMRWRRDGRDEVPPSVFVPLAEEAGLMAELGAWSLRKACAIAATWPQDLRVAVNLSARQLNDDLPGTVAEALRRSGLAPHRLCLEVTETAVFADIAAAATRLRAVADLGVCVSLDDFGTGYSSLAYLRDFPVHALKVDRSFVAGLERNPDDTAIVATLVALAASLGVEVIAEGVETTEQLHALRRLGCDFGQGYLWRPALEPDDFLRAVTDIAKESVPRDPAPRPRRTRELREDPLVVARILAMHRQGASPATIAAALNLEGVVTATGRRWHASTVAHLVAEQRPGS